MLLGHKDESRDWMSIRDGPAGRSVMLTVEIWSTTPLNFSNVPRNDDIESITAIGLSMLLTADAVLLTDTATGLIPEVAFPVASISLAGSAVLISEVSNWSVIVSWLFMSTFVDGSAEHNGEDLGRFGIGSDIFIWRFHDDGRQRG